MNKIASHSKIEKNRECKQRYVWNQFSLLKDNKI